MFLIFYLFCQDLQACLVDWRETLLCDRYLRALYNPSPKIWGCPIRNSGANICKICDEIAQILILIVNIGRQKFVYFGPLTKTFKA